MKYYKLFDLMAPDGDLYRVDEKSGEAWQVTDRDEEPIAAFVMSAEFAGTSQFDQLQYYASKWGRLEEVPAP